jgi:hypothetical protein
MKTRDLSRSAGLFNALREVDLPVAPKCECDHPHLSHDATGRCLYRGCRCRNYLPKES